MATFLVMSKDGYNVHLRNCVRIAKKSLIFDNPVDGNTQVPKNRCYYYDNSKAVYLEQLKSLTNKEQVLEWLNSRFIKVVAKSTRL